MPFALQLTLLVLVLAFLGVILYRLRTDKMTLQYSLIWLLAGGMLLLFLLFPGVLTELARLVGVEVTSNFVFLIEGVFVLIILLLLTGVVSKQRRQIVRLAQEIALLERRLRDLEAEKKQ